jgi:hypothetical protein
VTLVVVLAVVVVIVVQGFERPSCLGEVGFNWPNAGRVGVDVGTARERIYTWSSCSVAARLVVLWWRAMAQVVRS